MLPFRVHQLFLSRRHCLLLPKLNGEQLAILAARLRGLGFSIRLASTMTATTPHMRIHVDPLGLCWSTVDPADTVLPAIPRMLACQKDKIPLRDLKAMYFKTARSRGKVRVRLATRLESFSRWDELRAKDESGLAPDEHAVISFILERAKGECTLLTDFPVDGRPVVLGKKRYFRSGLDAHEAGLILRQAGARSQRNGYVSRDGVMELEGDFDLPNNDLRGMFRSLGEWCFFEPL